MSEPSYRSRLSGRGITKGALFLLAAELSVSLIFLLSGDDIRLHMMRWLTANAYQVWHDFKLWTLVTSALINGELIALLFHGVILWLFVPVLERWWGTKKFLFFALWTSLAGTIAGTLLGLAIGDPSPVAGLDAFIYGAIVAFGVLYANRPVQFFGVLPLTGRQLMIGMIVIAALFVLLGGRWVSGASYAAAMTLSWLLTSGRWNPRLWYLRWRQKRIRRHLKIVRGGKDRETWLN